MTIYDQKKQDVDTQFNALSQIINLTLITAPNISEEQIKNIKEQAKEYFSELDDLKNAQEITDSLIAILQKEFDKDQTEEYLKSIKILSKMLEPVIVDYLNNSSKILPYTSILNSLLKQLVEYFYQNDCFSLYGYSIDYEYQGTDRFDHPGVTIVPLHATHLNNLVVESSFFKTFTKRIVIPLNYTSSLLKDDPFFKTKLGSEGRLLLERKTKTIEIPVDSKSNRIFEFFNLTSFVEYIEHEEIFGLLYYQTPSSVSRIYIFDQYFISIDSRDGAKLPLRTFSCLLYGILLDALNYIRRVNIEASIGKKTLAATEQILVK